MAPLVAFYEGRFEEMFFVPLNAYLSCINTKSTTGSTCYAETLALLKCIGDSPNGICASEFEVSVNCAAFGGTCATQIADWVGCATEYCAETYLIAYGRCIEEQQKQSLCSACPRLVVDGAFVVLNPT